VSAEPETEGVRIESTLVTRMGDGSYVERTRGESRIAELLDLPSSCVARFRKRVRSLSARQAGRSS
jgi:hypothetical protein